MKAKRKTTMKPPKTPPDLAALKGITSRLANDRLRDLQKAIECLDAISILGINAEDGIIDLQKYAGDVYWIAERLQATCDEIESDLDAALDALHPDAKETREMYQRRRDEADIAELEERVANLRKRLVEVRP